MYVTDEQLKGFDSYKYSCIDTSPLSKYVMHPFWNTVVKCFPEWLAPNVMTFAGFMLLVIQFIILAYYDPVYSTAALSSFPAWIWWFSAAAQFFSHTLDGCDGKQARRTHSSSPLGELFDHGLDSWCVSLFTLNVYSIFGIGLVTAETLYFVHLVTIACFFYSHWEKYITGVLYLPWGYDISQVVLFIVYIVTAVKSVEFWSGSMFGIAYTVILKGVMFGSAFFLSFPMGSYNIYIAYREGTVKQSSLYEAFVPAISPILLTLILHTWVVYSPCDILHTSPKLLFYAMSVAFSNVLCRLIVSQMSGTRCQLLNMFVLPLALCLASTLYFNDPKVDFYLIVATTVMMSLCHIHYGIVVVDTLASHFKIKVFSIKKASD